MEIKTISRTISFGNYQNIGMTADVGNDIPEIVLKNLEEKMNRIIEEKTHLKTIYYDVKNLERKKESLLIEINNMMATQKKLIDWAKKHNIKDDVFDDLPF